MRLRALEVFVELAQAESIRQLARQHGVKASAISRQIESVEYFFHAELFDRNAEGITLTEAGRLLVAHAREILGTVRNAQTLVGDLRSLTRGEVIIYASAALASGVLVPVAATLNAAYPGLCFTIQHASATEVFGAVANGIADLGLTMFAPETDKVEMRLRVHHDHVLIVSPYHPLAARDRISVQDLAQTALALPGRNFGARRRLDQIAAENGLTIEPVFRTDDLSTQKELAALGVAALLLPEICCQREIAAGSLRAVPLDCDGAFVTSFDLCSTKGRTLSFAAKKLAEGLSKAMTAAPADHPRGA